MKDFDENDFDFDDSDADIKISKVRTPKDFKKDDFDLPYEA